MVVCRSIGSVRIDVVRSLSFEMMMRQQRRKENIYKKDQTARKDPGRSLAYESISL